MANRLFIIAPVALAVSAAFIGAAAAPAAAATVCDTAPAQLRAIAATADAAKQKKALYYVSTGVQLCDAQSAFEAKKQFSAAAKLLGTDLATLPTTTASAQ